MPQSFLEFKDKSGIYLIVNKVNGHRYIGSSVNLKSRFLGHRNKLENSKHENSHLQRAWDKYGSESFEFKALFFCEKGQLVEQEGILLKAAVGSPDCYNISLDPCAAMRGRKHLPESIAKMVAIRTGTKRSAETKARMSASGKARNWKPTPEHLEKTRLANIGRKPSAETRAKMSQNHACKRLKEAGLKREISEETRRRMSDSAKSRPPISAETSAKMSQIRAGRIRGPMPEAQKRLLSERANKRIQDPEFRKKMSKGAVCDQDGKLYVSATEAARMNDVSCGFVIRQLNGFKPKRQMEPRLRKLSFKWQSSIEEAQEANVSKEIG